MLKYNSFIGALSLLGFFHFIEDLSIKLQTSTSCYAKVKRGKHLHPSLNNKRINNKRLRLLSLHTLHFPNQLPHSCLQCHNQSMSSWKQRFAKMTLNFSMHFSLAIKFSCLSFGKKSFDDSLTRWLSCSIDVGLDPNSWWLTRSWSTSLHWLLMLSNNPRSFLMMKTQSLGHQANFDSPLVDGWLGCSFPISNLIPLLRMTRVIPSPFAI